MTSVFNEIEIRQVIRLDPQILDAIESGFASIACGEVTTPPIMRIDIEKAHGEVDVKSAYIHGLDSFAIKIASGFPENKKLSLPTGSGMMVLFSAQTGQPLAVLLDNGYLTDVRTGAAGGVAARWLAPENVRTAGVIGSGMQARFQVRALKLVREVEQLYVFGIDSDQVNSYAESISCELGVEVTIAADPEMVVRESELVITSTPSTTPIIQADWLHAGMHITCMGSDAPHKQELHPDVFARADLVACDVRSQVFQLGEVHHALEAGTVLEENVVELGEIITNKSPGRTNADQITICDLTGTGVQDTVIARMAYQHLSTNQQ
jgi:ornithine cyclodeaminase